MKEIREEDIINFAQARYESNRTFLPNAVIKAALSSYNGAEYTAKRINELAKKGVKEFNIFITERESTSSDVEPIIAEFTGMYDDESNSLDPVVAYPNDICLEMSNPSWIQDDQDLCKEVAKAFYIIVAQMVYSIPAYVDTSIFPINIERVYDQSEKCCDGYRNTYKLKLSFPTSMEVI